MLAMGEEVEHESLLWNEEQSWAFPNLATAQEDKSAGMMSDSAKDKEAPPPPPVKGKKRSAAAAGESEDHELHIWTERERRKKMRNMFSNLHALLPHIPPKADKSTIVDEAVKHIKKLQQTVQELEKQKMGVGVTRSHNKLMTVQSSIELAFAAEGPSPVYWGPEFPAVFKTWTSPNVILNICGRDAQMSVCSMRKPGLLTALCFVMEKNNLELVSAQASSDRATCIYMIHARLANGGLDQLQHAFPIEEIFKQAAAEIMMFVNS